MDNSATASGTPPTGPATTAPPSTASPPIASAPALTITKTADKSTYAAVGDVITYTYALKNTGNVTINGVSVSDDKLGTINNCTPANLAPGASATCSATHTVTQPDLDAGSITNVATGHGTPASGTLTPPTATLTVTAKANPIAATNDTGTVSNGTSGGQAIASILANDGLNGSAPTTATVTVTVKAGSSVPPQLAFDPSTGTVGVKPNTPAGTYVFDYTICEKVNTSNCASATVTVMVGAAPIVATPDTYAGISGASGTTTASVIINDTLNGVALTTGDIGTKVTLTPGTAPTVPSGGITMNPDGTITVQPGTTAGTYTYPYTICEKLNPTNCSTTTATVTVTAAVIKATDDNHSADPVNGGNGGNLPTVLGNDTVNGQPTSTSNVTLTPGTAPVTASGGIVMNPDGTITVKPGTPAGMYAYPYTICEKLNPTNCATATATIKVTAPVIVATPDTPPALESVAGGNTPSVLVNDSINGQAATTGNVTLNPGASPNPGLVMNPNGTITVKPNTPAGTYVYPYTICDRINPTNCASTTATVVVTAPAAMRVTKTATPANVHVGDLVRYTLTIENTGSVPVNGATLVDTPPAGFSYVDKSMTVVDRDNAANMIAIRTLNVSGIDIDVGQRAVVTYMLRVGAGVHPGTWTNQALMQDHGRDASNVATADVQVVGDPMTDDALILGTVFDDRDGDGWQDSADASGLKVQGGFSPAAYIANSTTVDRGDGPKPEADHSSPMLHGIPLGELKGRQSDADPLSKHRIVIRQHLRELAFNDDFVLTSKEGVTVHMDAAGKTRVETSGDAAKGLNAVDLRVERKVAQTADGYEVDYVISNAGVDERGIPGVRIASVEGLLVETDQFGRYHLAAIDGGSDRGRNFILKVDPSTLPPGTTFTTDNPLVRRVTPGLPVRFDFGVKLPQGVIEGGKSQVEMELGEVVFAPGHAEVREQYQPAIAKMADKAREQGGGEVVIRATGETAALAYQRAEAVKTALLGKLDKATADGLTVSLRTDVDDPSTLVAGVDGSGILLGNVLFDTDKATIRPEFEKLLDSVAVAIEERGGGEIAIVGHTDTRGSHAYNAELGLRRAKAVYEALAKRLKPETRAKVRVDINNDSAAPVDAPRKSGDVR
ncbi:MAG: DUF11 domain-containing protein [Proteobacteria bacterium]|nr:DUF11 domain-containing protein [Pseudomonadota bacterium]